MLPAPLPAVVAVLMVAGVFGLARRFCTVPELRGAAFIVSLALIGALVHGLALAHLASLPVLRTLAALLVLSGCLAIPSCFRAARQLGKRFSGGTLLDQVAVAVSAIAIAALFLAALGPVTDADSLDYHLGVPLDWLRNGGVHVQAHWLHARLTGLGEALNMLGLAAGTDCLGAVLQVAGLLVVIEGVTGSASGYASGLKDRILALMLVLPPAILPLTTAQKPQLLPAAALVVAFGLAGTASSGAGYLLLFGCTAFAVACKYSFVVPAAVVVTIALARAGRRGRVRVAGLGAVAAFVLLVLPVALRNFTFYGDPFSPFLEGLKAQPDAELTQFAAYLAAVGGNHDAAGMGRFLLHLIVPSGMGDVQTILGIGMIGLLLAVGVGVAGSGTALAGFGVVVVFTLWRGQMASRYLLEAWFWCVPAVAAVPAGWLKRVLYPGMAVQTAGVAAMAVFAAGVLFPGALTPGLRASVMARATYGYAEAEWADHMLPPDTVMMSASRAYALMPRPFQIPECASCGGATLRQLLRRDDFYEGAALTFIVDEPLLDRLPAGCAGRIIAGPQHFHLATRNPFNGGEYEVVAEEVHCE